MDRSRVWEELYRQTPLCEVPRHFAGIAHSPFLLDYLEDVLRRCPDGGRTLETGVGSGYGAIWLSRRGICAEGLDYSQVIVERARQINSMLGGSAHFRAGDLFDLYREDGPRYDVIHHQGVLEHFTVPQIHAALAQQVALAQFVVFSVPSVYYPFDPEFGDERLLPLDEWRCILAPFHIEELRYYGDPQLGGREHVLCALAGQRADEALLARMTPEPEPYIEGISAIVHTRNESRHIGDCLKSLQSFVDEIIVCDMESTDGTTEIAQTFTETVVAHPLIPHFDRARNVSAMRARFRWVLYLDADERVPAGLGPALREWIAQEGSQYAALLLPFRHFFCGHPMQCLYPGYTAPRLLRNGKFVFRARLHAGASVDGAIATFPADNPDLALVHYSFDSLTHYLDKLNRYTSGEAESMHRDGANFHWQRAIAHFVEDFQGYYDRGRATEDGVHGFLYSFLSAFYRFEQHAKLFERRLQHGQLQTAEQAIPQSVEQVLEFALALARQKPRRQAALIRVQEPAMEAEPRSATIVWSGPLLDPSGYGEESRNFVFALQDAGADLAAHPFPWSDEAAPLSEADRKRLALLAQRTAAPGFAQIVQDFPTRFHRHPQAGIAIGRTMFETDRLPLDWVEACNRMDAIWVPSEFNRRTFADAGVAQEKLAVVPGCLDPDAFPLDAEATELGRELATYGSFRFLSVFDWTRHKGWDVLLPTFLKAFPVESGVRLVLKVWSTNGYSPEQIREQAAEHVRATLGLDLLVDERVRFVFARLPAPDLAALYRACNAFVLPSRGEGWGRPYMEAMAFGLPTIGTNWSGNTAFMTQENSYLVDCRLIPVPETGWREIPSYRGHRWAEPDAGSLRVAMLRVAEAREEALARGGLARRNVLEQCCRARVGALMEAELERIRASVRSRAEITAIESDERESHPVAVSPGAGNGSNVPAARVKSNELTGHAPSGPAVGVENRLASVRLEGAVFAWHSLAHVNRNLALGLLAGGAEISLSPTEPNHFDPTRFPEFRPLLGLDFKPLSRPADIHIRHLFPPRFERPSEGKFVLIQPWEYGYLPKGWVEPILRNVDEIWCYSDYVRGVYRASGIPEERLQVVPLGVDSAVFRPDMPPYVFTTEAGASRVGVETGERFVFLFVGGTLQRKGIDILLEAYQKSFSAYDDVCLVIKDTGTQTVYRGQNDRENILTLTQDTTRPAVIYLDDELPAAQLAGLYTAADCVVLPYRGEGFCLPALEALSCGVPVIVPDGGPTDDFVDETAGWRVVAERRAFGGGRIGEWECAGSTWMFEVSPRDLGRAMRQAFQDPEEAKRRGAAGADRVRGGVSGALGWTWEHTSSRALERINSLRETQGSSAADAAGGPELRQERRTAGPSRDRYERDRRAAARTAGAGRTAPKLTLAMIVRNEERVLDACLTSVKRHVDEIVVVDTGSSDRTVEIAEAHGARVAHFPWCDDFSAARNVSLTQASGDWILWMDADDTLPEECGAELRRLILLAESDVSGFIMQVHIPPAPGDDGFTVVDHVKIFRNKPEHRFEGRIHEQILEPIYRAGGKIERTNLYVVHSGYD